MTEKTTICQRPISRRSLLQGSAGRGARRRRLGRKRRRKAAGGKVIIGAFADGGLTPFKEKIIPLAK